MKLGFDGLMLDTIDTAPYLENKDPARFAGSRQALRDWLRALRARFPRAVVVANGSEALVDAAPFVDGFVVEGMFAIYDFGRQASTARRPTPNGLEAGRDRARARRRAAPVFSIEYADIGDITLARWAAERSAHGFRPYVASERSQRVAMTPRPDVSDFDLHVSILF